MSTHQNKRVMRSQKRKAPVHTEPINIGRKRRRQNDLNDDQPNTLAQSHMGIPVQPGLEGRMSDSVTESVPDTLWGTPTIISEDTPDPMMIMMAKVSAMGLQISELEERYGRTQGGVLPTMATNSQMTPVPQLSPHSQLFPQPTPSEENAPSVSHLDPTGDNILKGAKNLPAFDDSTEDFQTWKLHLESVAEIYKWTDNQKRCVVLSSLQGEPAKFVFKALGPEVQNSYKALIEELTTWFTEFESKKVYQAKYWNLKQEPGQSEQELAATIKMIYGRAFPGRDWKISQEDMVSKFLEALQDNEQHTALEYPTVPETLDAALQQAIHYQEAA